MKGKVHRLPPRRRLAGAVLFIAAVSWVVVAVSILETPDPAGRWRMVFQASLTIACVTTIPPILVALLGDRLKTVADAYLIGYAHGREDGDIEEPVRPPLRLVE